MSSELVSKNYDYEVSHWKGNNRVFDMKCIDMKCIEQYIIKSFWSVITDKGTGKCEHMYFMHQMNDGKGNSKTKFIRPIHR